MRHRLVGPVPRSTEFPRAAHKRISPLLGMRVRAGQSARRASRRKNKNFETVEARLHGQLRGELALAVRGGRNKDANFFASDPAQNAIKLFQSELHPPRFFGVQFGMDQVVDRSPGDVISFPRLACSRVISDDPEQPGDCIIRNRFETLSVVPSTLLGLSTEVNQFALFGL